ncbi:MAG TPA: hypothetical protein PKE14_11055, partial [Chitinophagales bacterium]|nr:hypothetical protein [Chitinophagales bacterium]
MLISMTGYGRTTFALNGKNIVLEVKTLNSKSFDLNLRIAPLFKEYEMEIRNLLSKYIIRGKTDCLLTYEQMDEKAGEININAIKEYYRQIKSISDDMGLEQANIMDLVFRLPNITTSSNEPLTDEQWEMV